MYSSDTDWEWETAVPAILYMDSKKIKMGPITDYLVEIGGHHPGELKSLKKSKLACMAAKQGATVETFEDESGGESGGAVGVRDADSSNIKDIKVFLAQMSSRQEQLEQRLEQRFSEASGTLSTRLAPGKESPKPGVHQCPENFFDPEIMLDYLDRSSFEALDFRLKEEFGLIGNRFESDALLIRLEAHKALVRVLQQVCRCSKIERPKWFEGLSQQILVCRLLWAAEKGVSAREVLAKVYAQVNSDDAVGIAVQECVQKASRFSDKKCTYCGKKGHTKADCWALDPTRKRNKKPTNSKAGAI
eukprot:gene21052-7889_t